MFKIASKESVLQTNRCHTTLDQNILFIPDKANSGECVLYRQANGTPDETLFPQPDTGSTGLEQAPLPQGHILPFNSQVCGGAEQSANLL